VLAGLVWSIFGNVVTSVSGHGIFSNDLTGVKVVAAPQAGIVKDVLLQPGNPVEAGDTILRLIDGDQSFEVTSLVDGHILEMLAVEGQYVPMGQTVSTVSKDAQDHVVVAFLPADQGKRVEPGMNAAIIPSTAKVEEYGTMSGRVLSVSERSVSSAELTVYLQNDQLVSFFSSEGQPIEVVIDVFEDSSTPSGFRWDIGTGPPFAITLGTLAEVQVTLKEQTPISMLFPIFERSGN
jgi:HlyD family secretion protein